MAERIGSSTVAFSGNIGLHYSAGIAGSKESKGPLGGFFDMTFEDDTLGQQTWEKSECELQRKAVELLLQKAGLKTGDVDIAFAGDLLNQCISSTFALRDTGIPLMGQYGACSTMAQTIAAAAVFIESGGAERALAMTSSHFCSAERQFRMPVEYGGQRTPTAQWTVTGAGAALLDKTASSPQIKHITVGRINDLKIMDANNMGAAMAPAAADTIRRFLADTRTVPDDYDMILTGDLGFVGSELLVQLMMSEGIDISHRHCDCGCMIFDRTGQDVHAGGSGCGCSASVFCSHIMQRLKSRELKNILFAATGALLSPTSSQQGESIPGIAHLVHIVA